MGRSASSQRWLDRQRNDHFVKARSRHGWRARSAFKLKEINDRDRLINKGSSVIDLGASPGGWSQVAVEAAGRKGRVVAVDLIEMAPLGGVTFICGDCRESLAQEQIRQAVGSERVDLVMSDMAPNMSGIKLADEAAAEELVYTALEVCDELLKPGGSFLVKMFQSASADELIKEMRARFARIARRKPEASRAGSSEFYVVARQFKL